MQPIPYELLIDLAEGRVPPHEAAVLRARIAADPQAQAELVALEEVMGLMRADDSVDAPEHVIGRAIRLMRRPAATPAGNSLRRILAVLKSDSWQMPRLAAGLRSVHPWPRALLLSAGDRELDLQVAPRSDGWQLHGQILGPEEPGTVVLSGPAARVTIPLNDLGEFTLPPVPAGRYTLTVTQGSLEIVVPDLELGPSSIQR
jgi:anti-sigma factor RsiW